MKQTRICLWSSPRNVSTALMYSFAQRSDTRVFDEALYPHFLRVTGAERPDRAATMSQMDTDGARVVREVILGDFPEAVQFHKLMPHFLVDLDRSFLRECKHVLLARDPRRILASYTKVIARPTMQDIGMADLKSLYDFLSAQGKPPPVLDAEYVLRDPRSVLAQLCEWLDIPFEEAMLSWPAGARPEDGPWAPYWYHAVHASTGFAPYRDKQVEVPAHLQELLDACEEPYSFLRSKAIRPPDIP